MNQTSLENANNTSGGTIQNLTNTTSQTTNKTVSTSSNSAINKSSNNSSVNSTVKNNTTYYNVTVKVPYKYWYKAKVKVAHTKYIKQKVKVKYKSYYKVKYKYHGKWYTKYKYKWKYKYVYKKVKKTYYTYTYKWTYQIRYKTVTQLTTTKPTTATSSSPATTSKDPYLLSSKNSQVNDSTIQSMAKKITSGATTYTAKATKIFNWVRDNLAYTFYYNTKYGAVKALQYKKGNCVDHAHLMAALMRAVGIKTRYVHINAKFSSGSTYGHVISEVYLNGKWVKADATSSKNSLGVIKSWTLVKFKGYYSSLPF